MATKKSEMLAAAFNPAAQFISTTTTDNTTTQASDPRFMETKSRRINTLVTPSLYERMKRLAQQEKRSVNDMMNLLLEEALAARGQE